MSHHVIAYVLALLALACACGFLCGCVDLSTPWGDLDIGPDNRGDRERVRTPCKPAARAAPVRRCVPERVVCVDGVCSVEPAWGVMP